MSDDLRAHDRALERLKALHPRSIDLTLGRLERLLARLDHPEQRLPPVVHVAGTNGKGSVIAFLRAIAEAAGLRVHVATSPHLVRFAERIRLAGQLITEPALADVLTRAEAANAGAPITFFEITAAAAFVAFSEAPADLLLLEVGLGGRFDATNVVAQPALSVITPIDFDHMEFLGDSLAKIAGEKAGIIKRGRPVVSARQALDAETVLVREADRLDAPIQILGRDFDAWTDQGRLILQMSDRLLDLPPPNLWGPHQLDNAALAVAAALGLGLDMSALELGVTSAVWPARMQRVLAGPLWRLAAARGSDLWLDGAHNPHAAEALSRTLAALNGRDGRPLVLIVGMLANKDADGLFTALSGLQPQVYTIGFASPTAADPQDLANQARRQGLQAQAQPDVMAALTTALADTSTPPPRIVICGSLYLAGEVLALSPETWPR